MEAITDLATSCIAIVLGSMVAAGGAQALDQQLGRVLLFIGVLSITLGGMGFAVSVGELFP